MSSSTPFTFGNRVGLLLLFVTSVVSASAILFLLSYIAHRAVAITRGSVRKWRFSGSAEVYLLNQLVWDLLQAVGGIMNIKWAIDASVHPGLTCTAQGAVKQASDVGAGLSTLIIAFYTIRTLCFPKTIARDSIDEDVNNTCSRDLHWSVGIITIQWIFVSLLVAVNAAVDGAYHFYGPTGLWCWIQAHYSIQRTLADFVFMWITAAFNIAIYVVVFLYFRGYITTDGWSISLSRTPDSERTRIMGPLKQAYGLLLFPFTYTVAVLPISIARYSTFAHHHVPQGVTFFVDIIYLSNGLFNVLLFTFTRRSLIRQDPPNTGIELGVPRTPPSQPEVLDDSTTHTGAAQPRQESSRNYHELQLSFEGDGTVRPSLGISFERNVTSRSAESLV